MLHFIARKRLAAGRLTVVDATNVQPESRKPLVELARQYHCLPVAIVLDLPDRICQERNAAAPIATSARTSRVRSPSSALAARPEAEGFRHVFVLETPEEVEVRRVERPSGTTAATSTVRSTSSATCMAASTS